METILKSASKEIHIASGKPFTMIGEKINPTGHKKLAAALTEGNFDYVRELAVRQTAWGADVLDVNVGVPGLDEIAAIRKVVKLVALASDLPLCLDSANPEVLAAGLAAAPGKPLVNSVSGEKKKLETVLPLVKEHSAAVIGLTMDDNGIPKTPEERMVVAERILERAAKLGIPAEDVIIDPLVLTVGSDSKGGLVTLETIALLRERLGVNVNVGASNVSFGLPERATVNQAFLTLCIQAGAACAITDPMKFGQAIRATDLLLGRDDNSMRYLKYFRAAEKLRLSEQATTGG
jgi:5-methyltetrahydrofolate--homocysteine methyltransferase